MEEAAGALQKLIDAIPEDIKYMIAQEVKRRQRLLRWQWSVLILIVGVMLAIGYLVSVNGM